MPAKERLEDYPDECPKTDRNCVDCLYLKTNIPLKAKPDRRAKQFLFSKAKPAVCKKHFLLRWNGLASAQLYEPKYQIKFDHIEKGFRHTDWNAASVCPHFNDMREDNGKQGKAGSDRLNDSLGEGLSGLMSKMDDGGGQVRSTPPGDEVLQPGTDEAIALPEIKAA
jgi:hypothetical protein